MSDLLHLLWLAYTYGVPFVFTLGVEIWLISLILDSYGSREPEVAQVPATRLHGFANVAVGLAGIGVVVGIAAFTSWAVNSPSGGCPASYDRQGAYSDC